MKQQPQWSVHLAPDGTTEWTTPTNRVRTTHPVDHLNRAVLPNRQTPGPKPDPTHADPPGHQRFIGDHPGESLLELTLARTLTLHGIHRTTHKHNENGSPGDRHYLNIRADDELLTQGSNNNDPPF